MIRLVWLACAAAAFGQDGRFERAASYYRAGLYGRTVAELEKPGPLPAPAEGMLAVSLFKAGRTADAVVRTRRLLASKFEDIDLTLTYAEYLYERNELEPAAAQVKEALRFAPSHPVSHFWSARLLLRQGSLPEAASAAERSVLLAPQLPYARHLLVRIYRAQGREEEAARQAAWLRTFEHRKADVP